MDIVDNEGNLLGYVNVVDALVVVFLVVVAMGGVGLVVAPDDEPDPDPVRTGSTYVTLDLGTQPQYLAEELAVGDTYAPDGNGNLTVTDVYVGPRGGEVWTLIRADTRGPIEDGSIRFDGDPLRLGREIQVTTDDLTVSGVVRRVGDGAGIRNETSAVLVRDTLAARDAAAISVGDSYTIAGREIGTVEDVTIYGTDDPDRRLAYVGLSLSTYAGRDRPRFGATTLREGVRVPFRTAEYALNGTVVRLNATELPGTATTREVSLVMEDVPPAQAEAVREGMIERVDGRQVARLTSVERRPSMVVLTSNEGEIFLREHPLNQDLVLTAELAVREAQNGYLFEGESIRPGSTVTLSLGEGTVTARVQSI